MKTKKLLIKLILCFTIFTLVGCSINVDDTSSNAPNNINTDSTTIGISISTLNNPFFVSLAKGAEQKAKEFGLNAIVVDARDDVAKQSNDVEDLISKNVSVIIINPVDSDAITPTVEDAISKGIKVISVDRVINGVEVDASISSDNVDGARIATEYLLELLGKDAKIAELEGVSGASATIERGKGFHSVADKNLNVVAKQTANFSRSEGLSVMENILQANPDIKGVFAHNDEMALGAIEAIGNKDIVVIGFDATDDALESINNNKMAATVAQKPDLMGETAIIVANKLIKGEMIEKNIAVEVNLITK